MSKTRGRLGLEIRCPRSDPEEPTLLAGRKSPSDYDPQCHRGSAKLPRLDERKALRYLHLNGRFVVFFCDRCGKRLDDEDPGEPRWEDYDAFIQAAKSGDEEAEEPEFLCKMCWSLDGQ